MTRHTIEIEYGEKLVTITCNDMSAVYPLSLMRSMEAPAFSAFIGATLNAMLLNSVIIEARK